MTTTIPRTHAPPLSGLISGLGQIRPHPSASAPSVRSAATTASSPHALINLVRVVRSLEARAPGYGHGDAESPAVEMPGAISGVSAGVSGGGSVSAGGRAGDAGQLLLLERDWTVSRLMLGCVAIYLHAWSGYGVQGCGDALGHWILCL